MHDRKPHIFTSCIRMADVLKQLKRGSGRGKSKKVRLSHRACNNLIIQGEYCCTCRRKLRLGPSRIITPCRAGWPPGSPHLAPKVGDSR